MDNGQRRKFLTLVYKTICFFSLFAITCAIYFSVDKLVVKENNVLWLDITILSASAIMFLFVLVDAIFTKKLHNKYLICIMYYIYFVLSFIAFITLGVYCYKAQINVNLYISYFLPLVLIFLTQIIFIVNLFLGFTISRLYKNNTITIDCSSETPNFNDEVMLKKKLNELNRKLSIKKIQDEIDRVENELNN